MAAIDNTKLNHNTNKILVWSSMASGTQIEKTIYKNNKKLGITSFVQEEAIFIFFIQILKSTPEAEKYYNHVTKNYNNTAYNLYYALFLSEVKHDRVKAKLYFKVQNYNYD